MVISAFLIFHKERNYAVPALRSFRLMVEKTRQAGLLVEAIVIMDRPDELTRKIVSIEGGWLDRIEVVDHGDLGETRNSGIQIAHGDYLSFFDGDDLWGKSWLVEAYREASSEKPNARSIWHPEILYYFDQRDWDSHSTTETPHSEARSFFFKHPSSETKSFQGETLFINNIWSANVFAHKDLHQRFPYLHADRNRGFGIEDWSWNLQTFTAGVQHKVVQNTIHIIRIKQSGSLGLANSLEGLLPMLPENPPDRRMS